MIRVTPVNGTIDLGRVGEHLAREVALSLDGIASGEGSALLLHQRSGDPAPKAPRVSRVFRARRVPPAPRVRKETKVTQVPRVPRGRRAMPEPRPR